MNENFQLCGIVNHIAIFHDGEYYYCDGSHHDYETEEEATRNARKEGRPFIANDEIMKKLIDMGYVRDSYSYNNDGILSETWRKRLSGRNQITFNKDDSVHINDELTFENLIKVYQIVEELNHPSESKQALLDKMDLIKKKIQDLHILSFATVHVTLNTEEEKDEELKNVYQNTNYYMTRYFESQYQRLKQKILSLDALMDKEVKDIMDISYEIIEREAQPESFDLYRACVSVKSTLAEIDMAINIHLKEI